MIDCTKRGNIDLSPIKSPKIPEKSFTNKTAPNIGKINQPKKKFFSKKTF